MELLFIGTGAADFSPLLKTEFKDKLDKNARRSSSLLIDGKYLIDCGPHVPCALRLLNADVKNISDIFITHFHADHYSERSLSELLNINKDIRVWYRGDSGVSVPAENTVKTELFKEYKAGSMKVTPLEANHIMFPQHFLFDIDGKKLFYGCDGAWMTTRTFYALKNARLDAFIPECTVGDYTGDYRAGEHNSIPMLRLLLPSLQTTGAIDGHTRIIISHIARTLHSSHETLSASLSKEGIDAAFDGMKISL